MKITRRPKRSRKRWEELKVAGQSLLVCLAALLMVVEGYGAFINGYRGDGGEDFYDHNYQSD